MLDLVSNIKELREFSLRKLLAISSLLLIFLAYYKKFHQDGFKDFLETVATISEKLNYNEWDSVVVTFQVFLGFVVVVSLVIYIFLGLLKTHYWDKMNNCRILNNKRESALNFTGQLFVTSSVSYINIIGYCNLLNARYFESKVLLFFSFFGMMFVVLMFVSFVLSNSDDGWY